MQSPTLLGKRKRAKEPKEVTFSTPPSRTAVGVHQSNDLLSPSKMPLTKRPARDRSISPPVIAKPSSEPATISIPHVAALSVTEVPRISSASPSMSTVNHLISSPFHLTTVHALTPSNNIDCVRLEELLHNPLIKECWAFNYLFDVGFLLGHFDLDVQDLVQLRIVHGFWKKDDPNKALIDEAVAKHKNVEAITAYLPEMFGTHHSKMFVLITHEGQAQVIIHTANMIRQDWDMCQAVWRSPLLPLADPNLAVMEEAPPKMGSGRRFKQDLLSYLSQYTHQGGGLKLKALIDQLKLYDCGSIKAALVASTPGRQTLSAIDLERETLFGWPGLRNVLRSVPTSSTSKNPHVTVQVSSVAHLGTTDKWLISSLFPALSASSASGSIDPTTRKKKVKFSLIFPTAEEVRRSTQGYSSGSSIHMKTETTSQAKQLQYLRPMLCHWAGDAQASESHSLVDLTGDNPIRKAGRHRTAPHIKTYMRFSDGDTMTKIDWALLTSANLSTQAWGGAATTPGGEVRICSYEIGVLVWPDLWKESEDEIVEMVPVFKKDMPDQSMETGVGAGEKGGKIVGLRIPFDLPLTRYGEGEMPWCASNPDMEPDSMGRIWPGYGARS
ncbi:hypothetical protein MMC25_006605 [Agyrium rufum]|nr:hypothetical protein [Agyrium rufum]